MIRIFKEGEGPRPNWGIDITKYHDDYMKGKWTAINIRFGKRVIRFRFNRPRGLKPCLSWKAI